MKSPIQIAIVDDNLEVREALVSLLTSSKMVATAFASAESFLEHQELERVSCLITDVKMDGMSGYELQRQLLARGFNFPVILMSAYFDARKAAEAISLGAVAFLLKPVDGEEILDYVEKAIAPKR